MIMKKYLILILFILLMCVSCDYPFRPTNTYLEIKGSNLDVWYQLIKDGETDTGEYKRYPDKGAWYYDIEPDTGYTIRLYIVTSTVIDGDVEKRLIGDTYETHFVIDHWETTLSVTYTEEEGLGCSIRKEGNID